MAMVSVTITGAGDMVCSGDAGATTRVSFLLQHGPLSDMTADVATLASTTGTPSISVLSKGQVRFCFKSSRPAAERNVAERPLERAATDGSSCSGQGALSTCSARRVQT